MSHYIGPSCSGVTCHMCRTNPATHKVGEEMLGDTTPFQEPKGPIDPYATCYRHNLTAYVCCECFGKIMGTLAQSWCNSGTAL